MIFLLKALEPKGLQAQNTRHLGRNSSTFNLTGFNAMLHANVLVITKAGARHAAPYNTAVAPQISRYDKWAANSCQSNTSSRSARDHARAEYLSALCCSLFNTLYGI